MENASKALIIAGAILISIVLVSVGVIVVNSLNTDDAVTTMNQQEIQAFNAKFVSSTGTKKSGSVVKSLISTVITNNSTYSSSEKQISMTYSTQKDKKTAADLTKLKDAIASGARYDVAPNYDANGLINSITITDSK